MTINKQLAIIFAIIGIIAFGIGYYLIFGRGNNYGYLLVGLSVILFVSSVWIYPFKTKEELINTFENKEVIIRNPNP